MDIKTFLNRKNNQIYDNNNNILANIDNLSDIISESFIILDKDFKIFYINKAASDTFSFNKNSSEHLKPGNFLNCKNTADNQNCGESINCQFCKIRKTIIDSVSKNKTATIETSIQIIENGINRSIDLSVKSRPIKLDNDTFILLSFEDISGIKRKHALERIFFHDILNTISGLSINLELLKNDKLDDDEKKIIIDKLNNINKSLYNEINSQKLLIYAENGTLEVQKNLITSTDLIYEIISYFSYNLENRSVELKHSEEIKSFSFISDHVLLKRILVNMVKNALEAENFEKKVTIGCDQEIDYVYFWVHNPSYISPEIQHDIFKRSFSTKDKNRGLGTYSMKLLGENYLNASVYFNSSKKDGTCFYIKLPRGNN